MIVVDSCVWIDHFNKRTENPSVQKLRNVSDPTEIIIGEIIVLELLMGARDERHATALSAVLDSFPIQPMLGRRLARQAAQLYRALRARGITVRKTPDLIIGAFCLDGDHMLLTSDRDFQPFADHLGLRLL